MYSAAFLHKSRWDSLSKTSTTWIKGFTSLESRNDNQFQYYQWAFIEGAKSANFGSFEWVVFVEGED